VQVIVQKIAAVNLWKKEAKGGEASRKRVVREHFNREGVAEEHTEEKHRWMAAAGR
jgi:hypothetical protein